MGPFRKPITRRSVLAGAGSVPLLAGGAAAQESSVDIHPRNLLASALPAGQIASVLQSRTAWHPYPRAAERFAWESLPAATRNALVAAGDASLKGEWRILPANVFLDFKRNGNRDRYEAVRNQRRARLQSLILAECVEGKGRFLDEIANGIWLTCEETFWGVPAHLNGKQAAAGLPDINDPTLDLFAAETSGLLSWTLYLLEPALAAVSAQIPSRVYQEVDQRVLKPGLDRELGWMGLHSSHPPNNWNPWICSNWLTSVLVAERDEKRRVAAVAKILHVLDQFVNGYAEDGGCDEGPSYWNVAGGSLFDCLEQLHSATEGRLDLYGVPLIQNIGRYIYRAHIAGDWYTNFADASARLQISGDMIYRYGKRIHDDRMCGLGAFAAQRNPDRPGGGSLLRQLPALFNLAEIRQARAFQPLVRDVWLPGVQVMSARMQEGSTAGLYLAAQGGHNAESHNHNDVGNFLVYSEGQPLLIDVGVETYTAKTFSSHRYEIWTMQSAYHNLPTIDGAMQSAGRQYAARDVKYEASEAQARISLEIGGAWPADAGIETWRRTLALERGRGEITVRDVFRLKQPAQKITLTLMSATQPIISSPGVISFAERQARVSFDASVFQPSVEEIRIQDARLRGSWGDRVWRTLLLAANPGATADWTIRVLPRP